MTEREEEEEDGAFGEAADTRGTDRGDEHEEVDFEPAVSHGVDRGREGEEPTEEVGGEEEGMAICVRGAPGTKYSKIAPAMYVTPEVIANPSSQAGPPRRP